MTSPFFLALLLCCLKSYSLGYDYEFQFGDRLPLVERILRRQFIDEPIPVIPVPAPSANEPEKTVPFIKPPPPPPPPLLPLIHHRPTTTTTTKPTTTPKPTTQLQIDTTTKAPPTTLPPPVTPHRPPPIAPTPPPVPKPNGVGSVGHNPCDNRPLPKPNKPARPVKPSAVNKPPRPPTTAKPQDALLYYINQQDEDGGYMFDFLAANSVYRMEKGYYKDDPNNKGEKILVKTGSYGFTTPEGVKFRVDYIADENGYRAFQSRPSD